MIFSPETPCDKPKTSEAKPGIVVRNENNPNELNRDLSVTSLKPNQKIIQQQRGEEPKQVDQNIIEKLSADYAGLGVRLLQRPRENDSVVLQQLSNRKRPSNASCKELFSKNVKSTDEIVKPAMPVVGRSQYPQMSSTPVEKTPHRLSDIQFKTPSIEYTSRRPSVLSRFPLNSAKSRSELTREFESKKIVFTTPSMVSRPPLPPLVDQSIDLSLEDSMLNGVAPLASPAKDSTCLDLFNGERPAAESSDDVLLINGKRFLLEKQIGVGGSSIVFLATKSESEEQLAVKVCGLLNSIL